MGMPKKSSYAEDSDQADMNTSMPKGGLTNRGGVADMACPQ
ncbi:MAG: hypothetical protein A4E45_01935 [Methanosaeta sp. PtaB.Bin039]|nr:MAG: hypothetical protein A4E45_01935 [Methanosaeta sp. PtaB.Bin039]OPY46359.1 MAG: hypothetical protein A4E47_00606 [Methanosaeta sp. PtaU1.Bin028]